MSAELLKTIRHKHQLTQSGMADILGVSRTTIAQIECGYRPITEFVHGRLAVHFKFDEELRDFIANLNNLKDLGM